MVQPSGTITFLFTDIEGSTSLWQAQPEAMSATLRRHDEIIRNHITTHGGYIFKTVGDAFCCAFNAAETALAASLAGQRALAAEPWPDGMAVRVRMALHSGTADERDGDYFGPTLNRVARLLAAGHGGQVLLSAATAGLLTDRLPAGVSLVDLGSHRLKDLVAPETIYQPAADGLVTGFPPLRTLDIARHNLPLQLTPLVGRKTQVEAVVGMLRQTNVRLITLTGVGGTGKTRLSLQVAAEVVDEYEHGVYFVDLAEVNDPDALAPAIIETLGIASSSLEPPQAILQKYLSGRQLLLILDNFEQVVGGAYLITALLAAAPRLEILVTSRELLLISGEHEFAVPPLAVPALGSPLSPAEYLGYEAVALFVSRASAINNAFRFDDESARVVAESCARLDGLPLAIELAAARTRLFTPQALLARLNERLDILGRGVRDRPERQQTLRSTIDWSYNLLDEADRTLFRRLAVFRGGWDMAEAEFVCADPSLDVLGGLESLLNKSLIRRVDGVGGQPRFSMLSTIGEYARDRLIAAGEETDLRRRHAATFFDLAAVAANELRTRHQLMWLNRLDMDIENLRAALDFYLDGENIGRGLAMAAALRDYWLYSYKHVEAEALYSRALALADQVEPAIRVDALMAAGLVLLYRNQISESIAILEEARTWAEKLGDPGRLAWIMMWLAIPGPLTKQEDVLRQARESVATLQMLGDSAGVTQGLNIIGERLRTFGDLEAAEHVYAEIIPLALEIGDFRRVVFQYANLGMIAYKRRDAPAMLRFSRLGFPIALEYRVEETATLFLVLVAVVAFWRGRHDLAGQLIGAADAWHEDMSVTRQATDAKVDLRMKNEIRRGIGQPAYDQAYLAGRSLSLPDAVALAQREIAALERLAAIAPITG